LHVYRLNRLSVTFDLLRADAKPIGDGGQRLFVRFLNLITLEPRSARRLDGCHPLWPNAGSTTAFFRQVPQIAPQPVELPDDEGIAFA
jgi:hypothetical protein